MANQSNSWSRLKSEYGPDLKLFRARFDHMRNPRNGKTERMIVLESKNSVNVVALTPERKMLFVRQYRFGIEEYTLELPGGIIEIGEPVEEAARREVREETGFTGNNWTSLGKVGANPVFQDSWIYHYLALEVRETHSTQLDDGEAMELVKLSLPAVKEKLMNGEFLHPHTVSALLRFFVHIGMELREQEDGAAF